MATPKLVKDKDGNLYADYGNKRVKLSKKDLESYQGIVTAAQQGKFKSDVEKEAIRAKHPISLEEVTVSAPRVKSKTKARQDAYDKAWSERRGLSLEEIGALNSLQFPSDADVARSAEAREAYNRENPRVNVGRNDEVYRANLAGADRQVRNTAFSDDKTLNRILNFSSPSQQIGAIVDAAKGRKSYWDSLGDGNSGWVGDTFMRNHPIAGNILNIGGDIALGGAATVANKGNRLTRGLYNAELATADAIEELPSKIKSSSPIFIPVKDSFTRGIGVSNKGVKDLVESGLVRGNPFGSEVTAHNFGKLWRKNRNHFRDIIEDSGVEDGAAKFFQRSLSEDEFNAIKASAKKFSPSENSNSNIKFFLEENNDPLEAYDDYNSYINYVNKGSATSINSDGQPLAYFYDDGRNPLFQGHDYAKSNYGVRILNASEYDPYIASGHQHLSLRQTPRLSDSNVQVFKREPFGLTVKVPKSRLRNIASDTRVSRLDNLRTLAKYNNPVKNAMEMAMYMGQGASNPADLFDKAKAFVKLNPKEFRLALSYPFRPKSLKTSKAIADKVANAAGYNGLWHGTGNVSDVGFNPIRYGLYQDAGDFAQHIRDLKPSDLHYKWAVDNNKQNIKVLELPWEAYRTRDTYDQFNSALNRIKYLSNEQFPFYDVNNPSTIKGAWDYDAGGFATKIDLNGDYRVSDVMKYNVDDYMKKYGNKFSNMPITDFIKDVKDNIKLNHNIYDGLAPKDFNRKMSRDILKPRVRDYLKSKTMRPLLTLLDNNFTDFIVTTRPKKLKYVSKKTEPSISLKKKLSKFDLDKY